MLDTTDNDADALANYAGEGVDGGHPRIEDANDGWYDARAIAGRVGNGGVEC